MYSKTPALLLPLLLACHPADPSDTSDSESLDDTAVEDTEITDTGTPWWEAEPGDADGDGITVAQGDCDDADPTVHPGQNDDPCNGRDDDCDGLIDEDLPPDVYEPNDDNPTWLGDLTSVPERLLFGYIHPETDVDRFSFYVEDEDWGYFDIEAWLYGVPLEADYILELHWVADPSGAPQGVVAVADSAGMGGYELINYGGSAGRDDSGWYELVVRSYAGCGCAAPYTVQILIGGW